MQTREIILLRHAQADSLVPGEVDSERGLTLHGDVEADAVGEWLKSHAANIDVVLCSPARRAQQTAERVLSALGSDIMLLSEKRIYNATPGDLIDVLSLHEKIERVLLVGHNPGLETLAALLTTGQSSDYRGIPTAGIAWLELPAHAVLEPAVAKLKYFWSPR